LPYTAVMFIIGTCMGVAAVRLDNVNILKEATLKYWVRIDSEVLLLVFLPGLIASDALNMDMHTFLGAFWQCMNFAFPSKLGCFFRIFFVLL